MSLAIKAHVLNERLSTHEPLRLEVELQNEGATPLEVPNFDDTSGSLMVEVLASDGAVARRMSAKSGQLMRAEGRPDARVTRGTLAPGATWTGSVDTMRMHYPLPAGELTVRTVYRLDPDRVVETPPVPVSVMEEPPRVVSALRDNPVLDGLALLLTSQAEDGPRHYLRHLTRNRPLAAWYAERVLQGVAATPFLAGNDFFRPTSFDPFYARWLLWEADGQVHAQLHVGGKPRGAPRVAALPAGEALLRSAITTVEGDLLVFTRADDALRCWRLLDSSLEARFEHRGPTTLAGTTLLTVRGHDGALHLASTLRGLRYERLSATGAVEWEEQPLTTPLPAWSCDLDPVGRSVLAVFSDGAEGRELRLARWKMDTQELTTLDLDVDLRGDLLEVAAGVNDKGVFQTLVSSPRGLYHYAGASGPRRVATGPGPFFPRVSAGKRTYLGCWRSGLGYRFLQVTPRRFDRKLTDYERAV